MSEAHLDPSVRHDFVLVFDVKDGNPNGDPDAGNLPRVDPETRQGLVSDVAIKRKVRNYVDTFHGDDANRKIYVQEGAVLNERHQRAYTALGLKPKKSQPADDVDKARAWMCENFYDVRSFGAVMSTGVNCGQVRGPIQLTFGRSVDPVFGMDVSITRVAVTNANESSANGDRSTVGTMGRKALIPYGLYVAHGYFVPSFAQKTGFDTADLELFWAALVGMWDLDRSASRGMTACREVFVFSHPNGLGAAPSHKLFDGVRIERRDDRPHPRSFDDYRVDVADPPDGVTLTRLVG